MNIKPLVRFIKARELLRVRKAKNLFPWTTDQVLRRWHFCNINREDDYVTKWIRQNVPIEKFVTPQLVYDLLVCRIFNEPEVLRLLLPTRCPSKAFLKILQDRQAQGLKIFRGAYMMATHGQKVPSAIFYRRMLGDFHSRFAMPLLTDISLAKVAANMQRFEGIGDFLSNQVVTDLRYHVKNAKLVFPDWYSFVLCGPGTLRGLARVYDDYKMPDSEMVRDLRDELISHVPELCQVYDDPNNVANSLCEFDKYQRALDQDVAGETVRLKRQYKSNPQS